LRKCWCSQQNSSESAVGEDHVEQEASRGVTTTVFHSGALFDGHRYRGSIGAIVVEQGLISAVIAADEPDRVRDAVDRAGAEVDLAGGLLAPGFVDAHVHAVQGGLERIRCDLSALLARDDYLAAIAAYAAQHCDEPWILGGGWALPAFPGGAPTAADLDAVVPDRPVFLPNRDHHGAWVNSCALELAGVRADTPDPPDGRFERDSDGRPTGTLHEGAMRNVARLVPPTPAEDYDRALRAGQDYLQSLGVVSWQDAIVGSYAGMDDTGPTYVRAARTGDLTSDVVGALWWDRELGLEQVESLVARRQEYSVGRFRAIAVKIMQDGVIENRTAAMSAPYLGSSGSGLSFVDPEVLNRAVAHLDANGFQVHVHAIGDRAVTEALEAFAYAGSRPERDRRHHIAHVQVVRPEDRPRFAQLGIAANLQALWACLDEQMVELTLPILDGQRASWQYPFAALHRVGARIVMGSDWPVSTADPLAAIHVAVNRTLYGEEGRAGSEPFLPEQALPLEVAFAAYTSGSSWVNFRASAGVVAPGRVADLVVLDRDPFAGPAAEIGSTRVSSTWIDGVPVFAR
jgi:predicted amidohydrolase YtcJ